MMIINKNQKGVSLIMTFFIVVIVLSIVISISVILYNQLRITRNMGSSVVAFFAADSGVEKVLYYDKQKLNGLIRGVCSISTNCTPRGPGSIGDNIYCNDPNGALSAPATFQYGTTDPTKGCDPTVCDDCMVSFMTTLDINKKITYTTNATILPSGIFQIYSKGVFAGTQRQINIYVNP